MLTIFTLIMGMKPHLADGACCLEAYSCSTESADVCTRLAGPTMRMQLAAMSTQNVKLADTTGDTTGAMMPAMMMPAVMIRLAQTTAPVPIVVGPVVWRTPVPFSTKTPARRPWAIGGRYNRKDRSGL